MEAKKILTSGYSSKISLVTPSDQKLVPQDFDENVSYCVYDEANNNLYCVHEVAKFKEITNSGAVSRWKYDKLKGTFQRKEVLSSLGEGPAHIALHLEIIFVTNYDGGSLAFFEIDEKNDGEIVNPPVYKEKMEGGSKIVADRQEAPHLHGTFFFKNHAYVVDLGSDLIYHYIIDKSGGKVRITKGEETFKSNPGEGPRHMAIDTNRNKAYILNELQSTIAVTTIEEKTGSLARVATVALDFKAEDCGQNKQYGAAIKIHGDCLYVSNRGLGSIFVFKIVGGQKHLEQVQIVPLDGTWPRDFIISDEGDEIFCADQLAENLACFSIDNAGLITKKKWNIACKNKPACVVLL